MLSGLVGSRKPKIESNIKIKCLIIHQKRTKLIAKHVYLLGRWRVRELSTHTIDEWRAHLMYTVHCTLNSVY